MSWNSVVVEDARFFSPIFRVCLTKYQGKFI